MPIFEESYLTGKGKKNEKTEEERRGKKNRLKQIEEEKGKERKEENRGRGKKRTRKRKEGKEENKGREDLRLVGDDEDGVGRLVYAWKLERDT